VTTPVDMLQGARAKGPDALRRCVLENGPELCGHPEAWTLVAEYCAESFRPKVGRKRGSRLAKFNTKFRAEVKEEAKASRVLLKVACVTVFNARWDGLERPDGKLFTIRQAESIMRGRV
jgi:hypothetical protein